MYAVDLCPGSKNYTPLNRISKFVQQTVVLTEDSGFYQHRGFDQEGIEHCFEKMKEKKKIVCGGSTLTQQLAKNLFLHKDKNFLRKGLEALITIKIENSLSKKEILERYLNVVQFGKNIFGIKQAAEFYFKKSPSELNVLEASFLAMILPNPEKYSQSYYRKDLTKFARRRLSDIIEKLYKYNRINQTDYLYAESNLDFFLKSGMDNNAQNRSIEELSSEDLSEMLDQVSEPHDDRPAHKTTATPELKNVEHQDDSEAIQNEKSEVELQN
jgi:monofunctional biosynthetic peptidoglycan transglycosylase